MNSHVDYGGGREESMAIIKTLNRLTYDDLKQHTAWVAIGDYAEVEDPELSPLEFDTEGRIPGNVGEVWCLCTAVFTNGSDHLATAMCRGDSGDGHYCGQCGMVMKTYHYYYLRHRLSYSLVGGQKSSRQNLVLM